MPVPSGNVLNEPQARPENLFYYFKNNNIDDTCHRAIFLAGSICIAVPSVAIRHGHSKLGVYFWIFGYVLVTSDRQPYPVFGISCSLTAHRLTAE